MEFRITILGSSSALPTSTRYPSAHVLKAHERFFLIDCGEGTQMQLRKNHIRLSRINDIFISHLHGDHIFGLYGLLSTLNLTGRESPLRLYAPEAFGTMLFSHLGDFDIMLRYEIEFIPLGGKDPKRIYEDKHITVSTIPLVHRIPAYGFLFREKEKPRNIRKEIIPLYNIPLAAIPAIKRGEDFITREGTLIPNSDLTIDPPETRSYAYCSDTSYFKRLSAMVKGVDLLYHESTFASDNSELAAISGHSTAADAATVARDAGAEQLIIGHFSARYRETSQLLMEAKSIFNNTIAAEDGLTISI